MQVESHLLELQVAGVDPRREIQDVVQDAEEGFGGRADELGGAKLLCGELAVQQQLDHPQHAAQRRPDLMAHIREKGALGTGDALGLSLGRGEGLPSLHLLRHVPGGACGPDDAPTGVANRPCAEAQMPGRPGAVPVDGFVVGEGLSAKHGLERRPVCCGSIGVHPARERLADEAGRIHSVYLPTCPVERRPAPLAVHGPDQIGELLHQVPGLGRGADGTRCPDGGTEGRGRQGVRQVSDPADFGADHLPPQPGEPVRAPPGISGIAA